MKSSGAGDQLKVKEQEIGFVDFIDGKIVVLKIARQKAPVRYEFNEPAGQRCLCICRSETGSESNVSCCQSIIYGCSQKSNQNNKEEARKLMQAAAAANAVPADTHEIFDDNYSLD